MLHRSKSRQDDPPYDDVPSVYVLRCTATGRVRFDYATKPRRRIEELRAQNSVPLDLLAVLPATRSAEKRLHRTFARHRHHGAWFELPISDVVEQVRAVLEEERAAPGSPSWAVLYEVAEGQAGYVTAQQAAAAGYSPQLIHAYVRADRLVRARRGIYRLKHFPPSEHEDLMVLWLWSEGQGVFSHETALALHDLSDALPDQIHMTLPPATRRRRRREPEGLVLHYADVAKRDRQWLALPVTSPGRTLGDCIRAHVSLDLVEQAFAQAKARGLLSGEEELTLRLLRRRARKGEL